MNVLATVLERNRHDELSRLSLLYELSRSFNELIELDQLIVQVMAKTKELLKAEGSAVLLLDEKTHELFFPYTADIAPEVEKRLTAVRFPADRGIAGWVLRHGVAQLVQDVTKDRRWYANVDKESGMVTRSLLCAPLRTHRGTLGVIELRNKTEGVFSVEDLKFLEALAGSVAVAIDNARLYQAVKESESRLRDEVGILQREMASRSNFADIVGTSTPMRRVFSLVESAITSPVTVLIEGETGTGKELIARAIHYNGPRRDQPFVTVNCAALPESLLESELFGYKKGAFTGAIADKRGLFEVAHGGTIFLDEVGETTPTMQVKLLRVLQSGEMLPVGDTQPRWVDARVISATNRDLELDIKHGRFRSDLYYRLNTYPIKMPPLRARREDIPLLAAHILRRTMQKFSRVVAGFTPRALNLLVEYPWPGNVRELENEIERALALVGSGDWIEVKHLSEKVTTKTSERLPGSAEPHSLKHARDLFERDYIRDILRQNHGNASRACKVLGISRVMLQRKIRAYGLREKVPSPRNAVDSPNASTQS